MIRSGHSRTSTFLICASTVSSIRGLLAVDGRAALTGRAPQRSLSGPPFFWFKEPMHAGQSSMPTDYFSEIWRSQVGTFRFHTFPIETNCCDEPYGDDSARNRAEDVANEDGSSMPARSNPERRDHVLRTVFYDDCQTPSAA